MNQIAQVYSIVNNVYHGLIILAVMFIIYCLWMGYIPYRIQKWIIDRRTKRIAWYKNEVQKINDTVTNMRDDGYENKDVQEYLESEERFLKKAKKYVR